MYVNMLCNLLVIRTNISIIKNSYQLSKENPIFIQICHFLLFFKHALCLESWLLVLEEAKRERPKPCKYLLTHHFYITIALT